MSVHVYVCVCVWSGRWSWLDLIKKVTGRYACPLTHTYAHAHAHVLPVLSMPRTHMNTQPNVVTALM